MGQYRLQRLNDQLRDEISQLIIRGEVKDPRVSTFLSINRVEVTSDLGYAKCYVSSFLPDGQLKHGVSGLNAAAGFIQREIAKKLRIRQFPKLQFVLDNNYKDKHIRGGNATKEKYAKFKENTENKGET